MQGLMTAMDAARELGVSRRRVLALIGAGRIKAQKLGVQWLIAPKDLKALRIGKPGRPKTREVRK